MKKTFLLYTDHTANLLEHLTDAQAGELFRLIVEYVATGEQKQTSDQAVAVAFSALKSLLDFDAEKYASICERNRKNGAKGGRPRKTQETQKTQVVILETQKNPKKPNTNTNSNTNSNMSVINDTIDELRANVFSEIKVQKFCTTYKVEPFVYTQLAEQIFTDWEVGEMEVERINLRHFVACLRIKAEAWRQAHNETKPKQDKKAWRGELVDGATMAYADILAKSKN